MKEMFDIFGPYHLHDTNEPTSVKSPPKAQSGATEGTEVGAKTNPVMRI